MCVSLVSLSIQCILNGSRLCDGVMGDGVMGENSLAAEFVPCRTPIKIYFELIFRIF